MIRLIVSIMLIFAAGAGAQFCEINGYVAMEAEAAAAVRDWDSIAGVSGTAMIDAGTRNDGYLSFPVTFTRTGNYYVYLLCRYTGSSSAEANDCIITLDGQKLYGCDDVTRPDGIRTHSAVIAWSSLPKGPGSSTPDNIRNSPVYAKVASAGTKTFKIISRSAGFVVDKIQLQLADDAKPLGTGYDPTLCSAPAVRPYFKLEPETQIVKVNRTATFTAELGGTPVLAYQWTRDGGYLAGAVEYRCRLGGVQPEDNGARITCTGTNAAGTVESREVWLVVYDPAAGLGEEVEAEDMTLSGYVIDAGLSNSAVTLPAGTDRGTAETVFSGMPGRYFIAASVIPENDGRPSISIAVGGTTVKTGTYPVEAVYSSMSFRIQFVAEGVELANGDVITLAGTADLDARARVDKLMIVPENYAGVRSGPEAHTRPPHAGTRLFNIDGTTVRPGTVPAGVYIEFSNEGIVKALSGPGSPGN